MREAVTDARGRFEVAGLPTGTVTVTLAPQFGFDTRDLERELELENPRGCGEANFTISRMAKARGSVVDAAGRPLSGVNVEAVAAELAGFDPPPFQDPVTTDARGAFEFDALPPGTYVFGVNLTKEPRAPRTGNPVFLPGTALARQAVTIELKPGDRCRGRRVAAGRPLNEVRISLEIASDPSAR